MWFLEHRFGQEPLREAVDEDLPDFNINMSFGAYLISNVRLIHFFSTIT